MCSVGHSVCSDAKMHLTNEAFKKRRADSFKNFPFPIFFESEFFRSVVLRKQNFLLSTKKKFSNHSSIKLKEFLLKLKIYLIVPYHLFNKFKFPVSQIFGRKIQIYRKLFPLPECFRPHIKKLEKLNSAVQFSRNF